MSKKQYKLIPLKKLKDEEKSIIEELLIHLGRERVLEVSEDRTKEIVDFVEKRGFSDKEAKRLASHFNAASEVVKNLPIEEREAIFNQIKAKQGMKP